MAFVPAITTLLAAWGCGDSGVPPVSGSTEEVTVKGRVTVAGKPATGGEIGFDPANINRRDVMARTAPVGKDGTFTVKTMDGQNMVTPKVNGKGYRTRPIDVKPGEDLVLEVTAESK